MSKVAGFLGFLIGSKTGASLLRFAAIFAVVVCGGCHRPPKWPPMLYVCGDVQRPCRPGLGATFCEYRAFEGHNEGKALLYCWRPTESYCKGCDWDMYLDCSMELPAQVKLGQPIPLKITVTNRSNTPRRIDPEETPLVLGHLKKSTLSVLCDGVGEQWTGTVRKEWKAPRDPSRYLTIPAGGSIENVVDISHYYKGMRGRCMVRWHGMLDDVIDVAKPHPPDQRRAVAVDCNWALTRIEP